MTEKTSKKKDEKMEDKSIFAKQRISASLTPNFLGWKPLNQDMRSLPRATTTKEAMDAARTGKPRAPVPITKSVEASIALHGKLNPDLKKKKQQV